MTGRTQLDPWRFSRRFEWAGMLLGFGLGGFFDGILLHQVLQWHHLLSGLEQAQQDIRLLVLADGLFHVLMYIVTIIGMVLLWATRKEHGTTGAGHRLLANTFIGFGVWHIFDAILSHWILGIHRIRMDTENPLLWDLLWLTLFGLAPLIIGWIIHRHGSGGGRKPHVALTLSLVAAIAGPISALPAPGDGTVMVLFRPGTSGPQAMAAIQASDGRFLWADSSQQLWAIELSQSGRTEALYRHGALLVTNSILPLGCFNWIEA